MGIQIHFTKDCIDLKQWRELVLTHATWHMPTEWDEWEKMLKNTSLLATAWNENKLIGSARLLTDFVRWGNIYDVVVHREFQGRGIGSRLIREILQHPSVQKARTFWLGTADKAEFYEKLGFRHVKNIDGHSLLYVRTEEHIC